ncbi:MAG: hypothetical protein HY911_13630 [Desulfobacterales bacterium]|nr:hypothetical protein [Desulfobacterales bacterium]
MLFRKNSPATQSNRASAGFIAACAVVLLVFWLCLEGGSAWADEKAEIRIRAGLDLFPSLLAADMGIENKKSPDGSLLLILLYTDQQTHARQLAVHLEQVRQIRGIPLRIEVSDALSLGKFDQQVPAGIFLTQPLADHLQAVIDYGQAKRVVVFSPFEGDVERGVMGGIHISDRLLPYLNVAALQASNVRIKSFFLRVAMRYEN